MAPSNMQIKITGALSFLNKYKGTSLAEIEKYFCEKFGDLMTKSKIRLAVVRALKNDIKNGTIVEKNKRYFLADPEIDCMSLRSADDVNKLGCMKRRRRRSACKRRKRQSRCRRRRRSSRRRRRTSRRRRSSRGRRRRRSTCKRRQRRSACKRRRRRSGCRRRSKTIFPVDESCSRTYSIQHRRPGEDSRTTEMKKTFHADYDRATPEDLGNHSDQ